MKLISWNLVYIDKKGKIELIGNICSDNLHKMQKSKYCLLLRDDQLKDYEEKIKNINAEEINNYINEMETVSEQQYKLREQYIKDWREFQKMCWGEDQELNPDSDSDSDSD